MRRIRVYSKRVFTGHYAPLLQSGVHFGLLQSVLYFIILCNVTATFIGYFAMVLAWIGGVVFSLRDGFRLSYYQSLLLSLGAYYFLLVLTRFAPPYYGLIPLIAVLIALTALPAGAFFRTYATRTTPYRIFFHENNGFILGNLLGLLLFLKFGIRVMFWGPFFSLLLLLFSLARRRVLPLLVYSAGAILALKIDLKLMSILFTVLFCYVLILDVKRMKPEKKPVRPASFPGLVRKPRLSYFVLFLAGLNLILLQYLITREFATVLAASELTILIVVTAYFIGYSMGYGLARYLSHRWLVLFATLSLFLHLLTLLSVKMISGYFIRAGMGMAVLITLILFTSLITSSFYSLLLPRMIALQGARKLARYYRIDLLGAASGIVLVWLSLQYFPGLLLPAYLTVMTILIYAVTGAGGSARLGLAGGIIIVAFLIMKQGQIQEMALEDYYTTRGYDYPRLLYSANSFYHSVDVIETYRDPLQQQPKSRASFINGVRYFDYKYTELGTFGRETGLSEFTWFLAELPARYLSEKLGRPLDILILGGGSLYSLRRVDPYARQTTLVEIDRKVIESAQQCWSELNHYDRLENARIVIDDAKHFLQTRAGHYDLIIMDISAPYYLGTMILHNRDFFRLVKQHLRTGGIFSESTQGRPYADRPDSQGMKILKGVADVFPYYRVIDGRSKPRGKHGFVMASDSTIFSTTELVKIMKEEGYYAGTATYSERSDHFDFSRTEAYSLRNMETLLSGNRWRMQKRLKLRSRDKKPVTQFPFWNYQLPSAVAHIRHNPLSVGLIVLVLAGFTVPVIMVWRQSGGD